jgi:transposase
MRGDRGNENFCEAHNTNSESEGLNGATQRLRKSMNQNRSQDLTDEQWRILDVLIPQSIARRDGRGRPWRPRRSVLNGILWVLRTGAPWSDLPDRYPSYQTCHRRFQQWVRSGIMRGILEALAEDLRIRGRLDIRESFIDGSFAPAKKGDRRSAKQNVAKERRSWPWQTATVFHLL